MIAENSQTLQKTIEQKPRPSEGNLGDFTTDSRLFLLSAMAVAIGVISAFVAKALLLLIALFTHIAFYGRISTQQTSPAFNHLGLFVMMIPVIGGLATGLMARFGSEKIRGHGIPEAL